MRVINKSDTTRRLTQNQLVLYSGPYTKTGHYECNEADKMWINVMWVHHLFQINTNTRVYIKALGTKYCLYGSLFLPLKKWPFLRIVWYQLTFARNFFFLQKIAFQLRIGLLSHLLWRSYISVQTSRLFFSFYDYTCDIDFSIQFYKSKVN